MSKGGEQSDKPASQHAETSVIAPEEMRTIVHQKDKAPEQIGPYKILQTLGEGGMGVVYLAEQREPIHRRVALKVVKAGMDTKEVVARFEAERQALATLDHPNIARVYDAGATEHGRPYFAMEHVPGVPITEYCDLHRLNTNERLELFSQVCDAVQHAHQNAIIHRDIKPSNVLVTIQNDRPAPKVIDFGVAKATNRRLTDKTIYTEVGQLIGTPEYMSPEQAEMTGLSIDTRADIYSLGVLLYELLVGALPFDSKQLRKAGYGEVQRIIREQEPPLMSTRFETLAGNESYEVATRRGIDVDALARDLRGDLDWITAKAMEKDRNRRYSSASELWADIERHLENEPVLARPPSTAYRMQKFIRRHRTGVAAGTFVVLALLAGVATTVWQAVRATRAEVAAIAQQKIAEKEARRFEANYRFMTEMLKSADPDETAGGKDVPVRVVLDTAGAKIGESYRGEPEIEADIRSTLGATYRQLGLYKVAEPHLRAVYELRRKALGEDHPETLSALHEVGMLLRDESNYPESEASLRAALEARKRTLGEEHRDTLDSAAALAEVLRREGRLPDSEELGRQTLEARRRTLGESSEDTLESMHWLGLTLRAQATKEKLEEAEKLLRQAVDGRSRVLGDENTQTLRSMNQLASVLKDRGRLDEAEPLMRKTLEIRKRRLPDDHPQTLTSMNQLALLLEQRGQYAEAEKLFRESLEGNRRSLGDKHESTVTAMTNLAGLYRETGRLDEAEPLLRDALEISRRVKADSPGTLGCLHSLAQLLRVKGDLPAAAQMYEQTLSAHEAVFGDKNPRTLIVMNGYGGCLLEMKRFDDAEPVLTKSYEGLAAALGPKNELTNRAKADLVRLYDVWGKPEKAAALKVPAS